MTKMKNGWHVNFVIDNQTYEKWIEFIKSENIAQRGHKSIGMKILRMVLTDVIDSIGKGEDFNFDKKYLEFKKIVGYE